MYVKTLASITTPGTKDKHNETFNQIKHKLEEIKDPQWVDSVPGFGVLNQDWFEFHAFVKATFGIPELKCFDEETNETFVQAVEEGDIILMLHYKLKEGEEKNHLPWMSFPPEDKLILEESEETNNE